jgi:hypothetical protein
MRVEEKYIVDECEGFWSEAKIVEAFSEHCTQYSVH